MRLFFNGPETAWPILPHLCRFSRTSPLKLTRFLPVPFWNYPYVGVPDLASGPRIACRLLTCESSVRSSLVSTFDAVSPDRPKNTESHGHDRTGATGKNADRPALSRRRNRAEDDADGTLRSVLIAFFHQRRVRVKQSKRQKLRRAAKTRRSQKRDFGKPSVARLGWERPIFWVVCASP